MFSGCLVRQLALLMLAIVGLLLSVLLAASPAAGNPEVALGREQRLYAQSNSIHMRFTELIRVRHL